MHVDANNKNFFKNLGNRCRNWKRFTYVWIYSYDIPTNEKKHSVFFNLSKKLMTILAHEQN